MSENRKFALVTGASQLLALESLAGDARARSDYMIHCQGCHLPGGRGFDDEVPDMRTSVPQLLTVDGGRAFLVQVPGSLQSSLSDERLAQVLNWIVITLPEEPVKGFVPFSAEEVAVLRVRLKDVGATREALLTGMEDPVGREAE